MEILNLDQKGLYLLEIEKRAIGHLYLKNRGEYNGDNFFEYSTQINPHVSTSTVAEFLDSLEKPDLEGNYYTLKIFPIFFFILNKEKLKNRHSNQSNIFSLLSGREVTLSSIDSTNGVKFVSKVFSCTLRNKNPFHEEYYSLRYSYQNVREESSYVNNKFIL